MKNCLKRKSVSLIIVVFLFAIILIPQGVAMARGYIDTSKKCSLKVNISEEWADLKSIDFSVKLYKVADVNQNCLFTPTKDFEDLREEIDSIDSDTTAEDWLKLAELSTNIITEKEISEYNIIEIKKGKGQLQNVDTGLYLIYADEVKSSKYGYKFVPYLLSAPNNVYATSGSGSDEWIYDNIEISMKPEQYELKGDLEIKKTLLKYNTSLGNPLFVFDIEAVDEEGNVVFSDVASIIFDSAGTRNVIVKDIPAGANVTVKEVYAGASYEVVSDSSLDVTIVAEDKVGVSFTNDYPKKLVYGTGVINHFEYDGVGWTWNPIEGN